MFSPIKNLITYIQKNATGNSIFGVNSTRGEVTAKMEAENIKTDKIDTNMETEIEVPKEICKADDAINDNVKGEDNINEENINSGSDMKDSDSKSLAAETTKTVSTENSCEYHDDEDDIEEQIESSIMLKTPVKVPTTNSSEIVEVRKASNANRSIFISHDINRTQTLTPIDDELEDFRHDPTEALRATSSPCLNQCDEEETENRDFKSLEDLTIEDEADGNKAEDEQKPVNDSDLDVAEEKDIETENEQHSVNDVDDEEDPFLELDRYKRRNLIVLDDIDLNASTASVETNNTADDPLAIACEEQEAFAADKTAVLEELNLLHNSQTSQDEDTRTTTDEDLRWSKSDLENNQPSCSSNYQLKESNSKAAPEKEERNGDGSDSGLGSETSALHITATSIADTSQLSINTATSTQTETQIKTKDSDNTLSSNSLRITNPPPTPRRSNLKRRLEVGDDVEGLNNLESASSFNEHSLLNGSIQKKPKRSINFDTVQVYYFPRQQGFSCVPSAGGCTLGMGASHIAFKTLTLAEHAAELRRAHRMQLQDIHPRGSSSEDSEESEEDYLSEGSGSDLDGESNGFLQPVSPKQRRALLKAAGIRKIDPSEKAECRNIRNSREVCGCTCRDFCDPETCACSQSGIKCQVDRDMFPCGCSRDACGNTIGRVEFNPTRVRTHYIHTLMRLEMENRQQQNPYSSAVASALQTTPSSYYQTHLQPQSNYSSGYASPAYNTASEIHHQSAASSYYHTQTPSTSNSLYGQQTPLEMTHNGGANSTTATSHYGIDSLDGSMFGGPTPAASAYGELMSVGSYHYGNLQTQESTYNSYHNASYLNANSNIASNSASNTYSSCAVPSIPPFGAATTTEATGVYHSVSTLPSLETTTAPSCSVNGTTSLESDANSSFISLSTPLASSSRLSQINDLLQHNRNATTALVAVSQNIDAADKKSVASLSLTLGNDNNLQAANSSLCPSINILPIEAAHKSCMTLAELESPLKSAQIVDYHDSESIKPLQLPETTESLIENTKDSHLLVNSDILPQSSLSENNKESTIMTASATIEPTTIEVAAGK